MTKKTVKKVEKKVWYIHVLHDSYCEVTRECDPDDSWGRDSTSTSHSVTGLRLVARDTHDSVSVEFEPEKGKIYHVLYAVWSTGDSFGHDEGLRFEVLGVYKNRKVAEQNEKRLREGSGNVRLKMEGREDTHEYYTPWSGYFESLDTLEVLSFVLN